MPAVRNNAAKSHSSTNVDRKRLNDSMRTKSTIKRLNMYRGGRAVRDKKGKILGGSHMSRHKTGGKDMPNAARVAPDRRWFGNTRVVGQRELEQFRQELGNKMADPYTVVLRHRKLPMGLLQDTGKVGRMHLLETESFESVFGPKRTRKRPKGMRARPGTPKDPL